MALYSKFTLSDPVCLILKLHEVSRTSCGGMCFGNYGVASLTVNFVEMGTISPMLFIKKDLSGCALYQDLAVTSML